MDYPENNNNNSSNNGNKENYSENGNNNNSFSETAGDYGQHYTRQTPSQIYDTERNYGTSPQYHYGRHIPVADYDYLAEQRRKNARRLRLRKEIKKSAYAPSLALLMFLAASVLFSVILVFPKLHYLYSTTCTVSSAIGVLYSVLTVALPFYVIAVAKKKTGHKITVPFGKPETPKTQTVLLVFIGFGGAIIANIITNIIDSFFGSFGVSASYSSGIEPKNTAELLFMILGTAVIPPLVEEYAMRGVILEPLRKYGNSFAIIVSAILFGLFHGNFVQIPFAFMCGLLLGYAVCATNSIWTGVIIHALVNGFSCLQSALTLYLGINASDIIMNILTVLIMLIGIVALVIYIFLYRGTDKTLDRYSRSDDLTPAQKLGAFFTNPIMLATVVIIFIEAFRGLSVS